MSRKRKPSQSTNETDSATGTALAEPEHPENTEETPNFAERVGGRSERVATPDPFAIAGDYLAGVYLFESRQDGQVALKFDDKPAQPVIDRLKEAGYRWKPTDAVWAKPVERGSAMGTRIDAERLYQELRQLVRQEKGIETGQDIPF